MSFSPLSAIQFFPEGILLVANAYLYVLLRGDKGKRIVLLLQIVERTGDHLDLCGRSFHPVAISFDLRDKSESWIDTEGTSTVVSVKTPKASRRRK